MTLIDSFRLDNHLAPTALRAALERDARAGLSANPKTLPPKWFYDARGSRLFDRITRLPSTTRPGVNVRSWPRTPRKSHP